MPLKITPLLHYITGHDIKVNIIPYQTSFYINGEKLIIFGMTINEKLLTNWCLFTTDLQECTCTY
jgi:hypothetical protein